jgi:nitroreductase
MLNFMELTTAIKLRQSVRGFQDKQVSDEQVQAVLTAAQNAPVAMGDFARVHLTVVQNPQVLEKLNDIFAETVGNPEAYPTYGAPTLIVVSNTTEDEDILMGSDAGCIMENMLLAATEQGLGSCFLFGLVQATKDNAEIPQLLGLPEGFRAVSAIAMGYPAAPVAERQVGQRIETNYIK